MKRLKYLLTFLAAAVLAFAFAVPAFAANHTVSTSSDTHTYQIYQIFTGDYDSESGQLQNLKYGQNAKTGEPGDSVSAEDMAALDAIAQASYTNDQAKITALTPYVDLTSTPIATIGKGADGSVSLAEGYYIIKDKDGSLADPETYTLYLFQVLGDDLAIAPKDGTTDVDKTVTETNDTTGVTVEERKGADYDQGDSIPYSIDITLAANVTDYKTYTVTLTDTLSAGLTPPTEEGITVTWKDAAGNPIENIPGTLSVDVDEQVITVTYTISNGQAAVGEITGAAVLNEAVINVSYNAVLNENAVVGLPGNPNTYSLEYSNNPNGDGTGETPEQKVIVYTYDLQVAKTDGNDEPLAGAGFTLYKKVTEGYAGAQTGAAIKTALGNSVDARKLDDAAYYVAIQMTEAATDTAVTHTTATTIDEGEYVLIETTVPAGYNAYAGENITITSTINEDGELTNLTATPEGSFTVNADLSVVSGTVENKSGAELPSTGGMGVTILYIVGGIMIVGAVVYLITKRRVARATKSSYTSDDIL